MIANDDKNLYYASKRAKSEITDCALDHPALTPEAKKCVDEARKALGKLMQSLYKETE